MYTTVQSYGIGKICYAFERRFSSMLHLFDKNAVKTLILWNTIKNSKKNYNLK